MQNSQQNSLQKAAAWSLYWQNGLLDSCIATTQGDDQQILFKHWQGFAASLVRSSHVLDLATGNGTVPVTLLSHNPTLNITGVDYANIAPQCYVQNNPLLAQVKFVANTDICALPYTDESFDAITSQFGFEYADVLLASKEFLRVLKVRGKFQLIIHHHQSEVVQPAKIKVWELLLLTEQNGLLTQLTAFIEQKISLSQLEKFGQQFLKQYDRQLSEAIAGQIFQAINHILDLFEKSANAEQLSLLVSNLIMRVEAELSRLQQLIAVALTEQEIQQLCQKIQQQVTKVSFSQVFTHDANGSAKDETIILAWCITGEK